jgi:hypothetical protein
MKRAARKDANHNRIMTAFIERGWTVLDIWQIKNACDIMICKNGQTVACEIKDGNKPPSARKLTSGEINFRDRWNESGHWRLIESYEDVLAVDREFTARAGL